jgi:hypothetical protein
MRARSVLLLLALALCLPLIPVAAARSGARDVVGAAFRVSPKAATGNESDVRVAYSASADRFLAVWCDSRGTGDPREIYGRLLAGDGRRLRGMHISDPAATGWEQYPAVATNAATGEFLVVWQDSRNPDPLDPLESDIYGRLVSAAGVPVGDGLPIATGVGEARNPAVAYNPATGGYLVVWQLWMPGSRNVYGRSLDAAGAPTGDAFLISANSNTTGSVEVAYSTATTRFLVVWARWKSGDYGIRGRMVSGAGQVVGAEFAIGTAQQAWDPDVAYDLGNDRFLVVWPRHNLSPDPRIYGLRITGAGMPDGDEFPISPPLAKDEAEAAVASNLTLGRFLVVWEDGRGAGTLNLYGRPVPGTGAMVDGDFRISAPVVVAGRAHPAAAFATGTGLFLVAWMDARLYATRGWDIRGRTVEG